MTQSTAESYRLEWQPDKAFLPRAGSLTSIGVKTQFIKYSLTHHFCTTVTLTLNN